MDNISVADPVREFQELADEVESAILRVVRSGSYVAGPEHDAFEAEFAAFVGADHGVATANCSDSLEISLSAIGCGAGDVVVTTANSGGFAVSAARNIGARPAFGDVLESSGLADPQDISELLDFGPTAVVVTHLFGQIHPDIEVITAACREREVTVIEDCAQATGARLEGRHAGTFGDIAVHSFYPTKNLGAMGDGGMITTDNAELAERVRQRRLLGPPASKSSDTTGLRNSRLDEIQAAILRVKLPHVESLSERRRSIAQLYREAAPQLWWSGTGGTSYSAHLVATRISERDRFRAEALDAGIQTAVHFPASETLDALCAPTHRSLPTTTAFCNEIVSLPCHPFMTPSEVERVSAFLKDWVSST